MGRNLKRLHILLCAVLGLAIAGRAADWQLHLGDQVYDFSETIVDHFHYLDFEGENEMKISGNFYISGSNGETYDASGIADFAKATSYSVTTTYGTPGTVNAADAPEFSHVRLYFDSDYKKIYITDLWYIVEGKQVGDEIVKGDKILMIPYLKSGFESFAENDFAYVCQRLYLPELLKLDYHMLLRMETYDGSRIIGQPGLDSNGYTDITYADGESNFATTPGISHLYWFRTPESYITEVTAYYVDNSNVDNSHRQYIEFSILEWYISICQPGKSEFEDKKMSPFTDTETPGYVSGYDFVALSDMKEKSRFYFKAKTKHFDLYEIYPENGDLLTTTSYDFANAPLYDGSIVNVYDNPEGAAAQRSYYLVDSDYLAMDIYFNFEQEKVRLVSREIYYIVGEFFGPNWRLPLNRYSGRTQDGKSNIYYIDLPKLPFDTPFYFYKEVSGQISKFLPVTTEKPNEYQIVEPFEWSPGSRNEFNGENFFTVDETYTNTRIYLRDNMPDVTIINRNDKFDPTIVDDYVPDTDNLVVYSAGEEADNIADIQYRPYDFFGVIQDKVVSLTRGWNGEDHLFSFNLTEVSYDMDFLITYKDGSTRRVEPFKFDDDYEKVNPDNKYPDDYYEEYENWDSFSEPDPGLQAFWHIFGPWEQIGDTYTSTQTYLTPAEYLKLYKNRYKAVSHLASGEYSGTTTDDGLAIIESAPDFRLSWIPKDELKIGEGKSRRSYATFTLGLMGPTDREADRPGTLNFNHTAPFMKQTVAEWNINTAGVDDVAYKVVVDCEYESVTAIGFDPTPKLSDFKVELQKVDAADLDVNLARSYHLLKGSNSQAIAYPNQLNSIAGSFKLTPAYFNTENLSGNALRLAQEFKENYTVSYDFYSSVRTGSNADGEELTDNTFIGSFRESKEAPLQPNTPFNIRNLSGDEEVTLMTRAVYTGTDGSVFRSMPVYITADNCEFIVDTPELDDKINFTHFFKSLDGDGKFDAASKWNLHFDTGFKVNSGLVYFPEYDAESNGAANVEPAHSNMSGIFGEDGQTNTSSVYFGYTPWDGVSEYMHSSDEGLAHNNWSVFFRDIKRINAVISEVADNVDEIKDLDITLRVKYPFVLFDIDENDAVTLATEAAPENAPALKAKALQAVRKITYVTREDNAVYAKTDDGFTTGIDEITLDSAGSTLEFYNLQGLRIDEPTQPGVYIVRKGKNTWKVRI